MHFVNSKTGEPGNVPWSKEHAEATGYARYMDDAGCETCGTSPVGRFVACGTCVQCASHDAADVWHLWKMGSPDRPENFATSRDEALVLGATSYYREVLCSGGVHFVQPHIKTGKCVRCEADKAAKRDAEKAKKAAEKAAKREADAPLSETFPDMVITRSEAAAIGSSVFRTGEPCQRGHMGWRYVSNGGCIACMRGAPVMLRPEPIPDRIVTIQEQLELFIGHAWDGRRIVSSDGKRRSREQFNIGFRGNGTQYEMRDGRPPVRTAFEAFVGNFVQSKAGS